MRFRTAAILSALLFAGPAFGQSITTYVSSPAPTPTPHAPRPTLSEAEQRDLQSKPLVSAGEVRVTEGRITSGEAFVAEPVRHGLTGVLSAEVKQTGWFNHEVLPAGQPVYGIPMGGPDGSGVVWCAPREDAKAKRWSAVCLPYGDNSNIWLPAAPALLATDLRWDDASAARTTPPVVERRTISFPSMSLSYAFAGCNTKGWPTVETRLDWGEGPVRLRAVAVAPEAGGSARLKILDGEIALTPSCAEGRAAVTVSRPLRSDAPIVF